MNYTGLLGIPIVVLLLGFTTWGEEKTTVEEVTAQGTSSLHYKIVRAEYIDLSGNRPHTNTVCHFINTSVYPITVTEIYVLGRGGANEIIATYLGLFGTVVPPLGRLDLAVDNSIPGVTPQTENGTAGVASVVFSWFGGSQDALKLSATIERNATGQTDMRAHIAVEGYDLVL